MSTNGSFHLILGNMERWGFKPQDVVGLKRLTLENTSLEYTKGMFPPGLEYLEIILRREVWHGNRCYPSEQHPIVEGALPSTLTGFVLDGYKHKLEKKVLPDGLESLTLTNHDLPIEPGVLPPGLKTLVHRNMKAPVAIPLGCSLHAQHSNQQPNGSVKVGDTTYLLFGEFP